MADEGESTTWSFGGRRGSRPISGQMRRWKRLKPPGFCFKPVDQPFCGVAEALYGRKVEIGWERGSRRREEREALSHAIVWTRARYTCTAKLYTPLDLGWNDRMAVIGLICKLIEWPGLFGFGSCVAWCTERSVHLMMWRNRIQSQIISTAEICWDMFGIFQIVFFFKSISYSGIEKAKQKWIVYKSILSLLFVLCVLPFFFLSLFFLFFLFFSPATVTGYL